MRVLQSRSVLGVVGFTAMALVAVACHPVPSGLVADYQFQDTTASSVGSPPQLTHINDNSLQNIFVTDTVDGIERRVLHFPLGNGLRLRPTSNVPMSTSHYTVVMLFRFADTSGIQRILQTKDDNSGVGLKAFNGGLFFQPVAPGPTDEFPPNTYVQVAVTRNEGGTVVAYLNGEQQLSFADDESNFGTIDDGLSLRFFDDVGTDESRGRVARIRIWDRALSAQEIAGLHRLT